MDIPTPSLPSPSTPTEARSPMEPPAAVPARPFGIICPVCHQPVTAAEYFCPNCGATLRPKPPSKRWWSQLYIYALSLLLPPLGLWPAWKYLKSDDEEARRIGWIAVGITIIAVIVSIWLFQLLIQQVDQAFNAQINSANF